MAREINVLHVSTWSTGGAANSCIRLHKGLLQQQIPSFVLFKNRDHALTNSEVFVPRIEIPSLDKRIRDKTRRILFELKLVKEARNKKPALNAEFLANVPKAIEYFSFPQTGIDIMQSPLYEKADIIHLHWVAEFLDYTSFFKQNQKPVVWTLHDMAPFSGGLHYSEKYRGLGANGLPLEKSFSELEKELMERNLLIKKKSLEKIRNLTIVAPSEWLKKESEASLLFSRFPHLKIPYGIDSDVFSKKDKRFARSVFQLPQDKKIILFVSDVLTNQRKGLFFLMEALKGVNDPDVLLCAVGSAPPPISSHPFIYLGRMGDERLMSLAYSSADVFVIPSLEDNLPNTLLEAHLCGTPVIGFPVGGVAETIIDQFNGLISKDTSVITLAEALNKFISNEFIFNRDEIEADARAKFNLKKQAHAYQELYLRILKEQ